MNSRTKHRIRTNYSKRKANIMRWWKYGVRKEEEPEKFKIEITDIHHRTKVRNRRRQRNG
jgi:hypothetical protein